MKSHLQQDFQIAQKEISQNQSGLMSQLIHAEAVKL